MPHYVYSTLTCSNTYAIFKKDDLRSNVSAIEKSVIIKGGHGVAQLDPVSGTFYTPRGVLTIVSDEDMEWLKDNVSFKHHVEGKFIHVEKKRVDVDKVVADMKDRDNSSPLTPKEFTKKDTDKDDGHGLEAYVADPKKPRL